MRRDIEDKSMTPGQNKDGRPDDEPEDEQPEPKPGLTVDAQPGQYPPPGSFAATGTVSPNNDDPAWYTSDRAEWDTSYRQETPPEPPSQ